MNKIKFTKVIFILTQIIALFFTIAKLIFKSLFKKTVFKFRVNDVNNLQTISTNESNQISKLYLKNSSKTKIIFENKIKTTTLLNSNAEINVMTKNLIHDA